MVICKIYKNLSLGKNLLDKSWCLINYAIISILGYKDKT